jgi:hypothetical protein
MLLMSGVCSHFLCVTYSDVELHVAPFDQSCLSGDTIDGCKVHLVPHFEACYLGVTVLLETFIFWELHGKYSIFQNCCWFEVAARGRAMR